MEQDSCQEDKRDRRRTLRIKAFGAELDIKGYDLLWVVIIAVIITLTYTNLSHSVEHKEIKDTQYRVLEAISEMTYVLSLPQDKRESLKIDMPETLRKKIKRNE